MFPQPNWLIKYEDYTEAIYKRPGATEFLEYCFRTFRAVGIWTASISERAKSIITALLPPGRSLAFLFTREHCQKSKTNEYHKPLSYLWNCPVLRKAGFSPSNTILIDDNPYCSTLDNLIHIPSYIEPNPDDHVLIHLVKHLSNITKSGDDVRNCDKSTFRRLVHV